MKAGNPATFESAVEPQSALETEAAPSVEAQRSTEPPPTADINVVSELRHEADPVGNSYEQTIITPWAVLNDAGDGQGVDVDFSSNPTVDRPAGSGPNSDIYALGVILYYMLTRQLPFQSKDLDELFRQIQEDEPQPIRQISREIPRDLEAVCLKAMAKNFTKRYTTADDLVSDLAKLSSGTDSGSHSVPLAPPGPVTAETIDLPSGDRSSIEEPVKSRPGGTGLSSRTSSVKSSTRSSTRRPRDAERRRITVVQCGCDVFGSDAILETLDEEEQNELLNEFQKLCQAAVIRHQGGVVQPTDEGLLACFGFPIAREDSTQQAVRAGLEIVRSMKPINDRLKRQHNLELTVTVTVHSDHAVVEEREESLTLTGQIRKVVGQLESFTESNSVLISEATYQLVKGYSEGLAQVVLLIGEAGLGKSRLGHVLKEHVKDQSTANCNPIIEWRTTQNHQHSGLYPAIECLERMLGFEPQTTPAERLDSLVGHLAELALDGDEEIALLVSMMSIPLAGRYPSLDLQP